MKERRLMDIYKEAYKNKVFSGIKLLSDFQHGEVVASGDMADEVFAELRLKAKEEPGIYHFYSPYPQDGSYSLHSGIVIDSLGDKE